MTKKIIALALAAIMTANVAANTISHANFAEVVEAIVVEAEKAGLSKEEIAQELLVASAAPELTTTQKNLLIATSAVVVAGIVTGLTLHHYGKWPFSAAVEKPADNKKEDVKKDEPKEDASKEDAEAPRVAPEAEVPVPVADPILGAGAGDPVVPVALGEMEPAPEVPGEPIIDRERANPVFIDHEAVRIEEPLLQPRRNPRFARPENPVRSNRIEHPRKAHNKKS